MGHSGIRFLYLIDSFLWVAFLNEFLIGDTVFSFTSNKRENCFINIVVENLYIENCAADASDCSVDVPQKQMGYLCVASDIFLKGSNIQNYVNGHVIYI